MCVCVCERSESYVRNLLDARDATEGAGLSCPAVGQKGELMCEDFSTATLVQIITFLIWIQFICGLKQILVSNPKMCLDSTSGVCV